MVLLDCLDHVRTNWEFFLDFCSDATPVLHEGGPHACFWNINTSAGVLWGWWRSAEIEHSGL